MLPTLEFEPMEARQVDELPDEPGWQFEPKWDGFRCLAYRSGSSIELKAKSGKPLGRYFPEVVESLGALRPDRFVLDGELVIPLGGALSFDALQNRLHPAESRIRKLAAETPAKLILFDCLHTPENRAVAPEPLSTRRAELERFCAGLDPEAGLALTPCTHDRTEAQAWLERVGDALDGVVAKRLDGPYRPGERAMLKVKRLRTADCVVGGFRYAQASREVGSLLLGLYDEEGRLHHVGFTSAITAAERPALTARLEALVEPPGFTGSAPDKPSRWNRDRPSQWVPLRPELVVEVRYDHVTGDRFRHGTKLVRWRPDKAPRQCTFDQLAQAAAPAVVAALTR
ncbi:MAG: ATP-dependent DNA ligase [Proteobacteria bacterium]|nr:ATP-dependent DNA ligase [Pseudomonadota bacterium]MBW3617762.1 ATP-dependent DNA ligase [Pseudomonadota bacterium]